MVVLVVVVVVDIVVAVTHPTTTKAAPKKETKFIVVVAALVGTIFRLSFSFFFFYFLVLLFYDTQPKPKSSFFPPSPSLGSIPPKRRRSHFRTKHYSSLLVNLPHIHRKHTTAKSRGIQFTIPETIYFIFSIKYIYSAPQKNGIYLFHSTFTCCAIKSRICKYYYKIHSLFLET